MPTLLTHKYHTFLAQHFLDGLSNGSPVVYAFLAHPLEWANTANASVNDTNPPVALETVQETDYDYWRGMIGAKRVTAANTQFVVARKDWVTNTVYDQYDDQDPNLLSSDFYVLDTSETPNKVYKCLWNNNGGASNVAPSTIGTTVNPTTTADNYVWQYMYTLDSQNSKFLSDDWMPVLTDSDVVQNAIAFPGRLPTAVPLIITSGGTNYNASVSTNTTIVGDGTGANVSSNGVTIVAGVVTSVILSSGGASYTQVSNVSISQNGVSNTATARAIIPPYPNHGADPVKELGASNLMLVATFSTDENGDLTVVNDFRRTGLLVNPIDATGNVANATFCRTTYDVTFSANTGVLQPDDLVTNVTKTTEPTAVVVDVIAGPNSNFIARLTSVAAMGESEPFSLADTIKNLTSGVEITVDSVAAPDLQPYTGSILFVNQRTPVTRANTQSEDIKVVCGF